jgi:hypothetical protein
MPNDEKKNERKIIVLRTYNFKIRLELLKKLDKKRETKPILVSLLFTPDFGKSGYKLTAVR